MYQYLTCCHQLKSLLLLFLTQCAAYKADFIPNLNPTPETPKPDKKDYPATNISHSEHFIDQMYEKMQIEKIKRDLIKDLKCEIKELATRRKEESLTATSFASLQSEIHYYREENRDKTLSLNN